MDNLPVHKIADEMAFFELKALLRNAAERAILGLLRKIGRIAKTFSPRVQT
jgi:hypothetical protein